MSTTFILAAIAFTAGFASGFKRPATYCSLSSEQAHGIANRIGSGLINGIIFGGIVAIVAYIAFGPSGV